MATGISQSDSGTVSSEKKRAAGDSGAIDSATKKPLKRSKRTPKTAADPEEVKVLQEFVEETGSTLANGWTLGKQLGQGMQGAVYALEEENGKDAGRVFKVIHHKLKAKVLGDIVLIEREWAIGRRLNLLNEEDGFLQGFMQTGSKVIDKDESLLGLILEKLNGKGVKDRLEDPKFCDVDYLLEMVKQSLEALDRARDAIGFRHGDMHIRNVMEHRIEAEADGTEPDTDDVAFGQSINLRGLHFKIIDYGHATVSKDLANDSEKARKALRYSAPKPPMFSTEHIYRWVFRERDDVWRFLRSIGQAIEGRVWHEKDELKVKLLLAIIRKATGYKHRAHFARSTEDGERKKSFFERIMSVGSRFFFVKWLNIMLLDRLHAYFFPGRPKMTPREALEYTEVKMEQLGVATWASGASSSK